MSVVKKEASNVDLSTGNEIIRIDNIVKSEQDSRDYRGICLQNGMKILLISDPSTDMAATALSVEVGQMSDPDYLPGLAHFCEHMLFLGTEKYPCENAYSSYLSQNGGTSNAATYSNMTKYYFDIAADKLEGALDRFAQFFISPLFTESATLREISAIDSEHEKNLSSDVWRVREVHKHLANPCHPYSKFGSGNRETLEINSKNLGINLRDELIKFHNMWYSANIMCLAILGKENLDELEKLAVDKFSKVENKSVVLPKWPGQPYNEDQYGVKTFIKPVKDLRLLRISFTTKDLDKFYKASPEQYLSHLIGHEGKGSILSMLRERGWCNSLLAGHTNISRGFGFFEITVSLTKDGLKHIDEIIEIIYQYINLLRSEGPKEWIFEEYCNLNKMLFCYKDKETPISFVNSVVPSMQLYSLEEVLSAPYLISEWRPDLIIDLLNDFVPENSRITIVGQCFKIEDAEIEPWYKTEYFQEEISKNDIMKWKNCTYNEKLKLPLPNPFIPKDFSLMPQDMDSNKHPVIIFDSPILRVWHKQDTEYLKPKTCMNFDFSNPMVYTDPVNCNLTHMFVILFKDKLNEYLYDAELAGQKFHVLNTTSGISIMIRGFTHKQPNLLDQVLDNFFNFKVNNERFDIFKEEYIRTLENFKANQPYEHANYYLDIILTESMWSKIELLESMELVTAERVQHFVQEFFSRLHVECFLYGNINKQKAFVIYDTVKRKLESTACVIFPLLSKQMLHKREHKLCKGESYLFEKPNEYHKSSCVELYLQCGVQTDLSVVLVDLIAQILTEPCYNCLRTKEQLGYIVLCGSRKVTGTVGIRIVVQSSRNPIYVEERIEEFLENMLIQIEEMPSEEFGRHAEALTSRKLEKPKKLMTMFYRYLNEISLAQYHFERAIAEVSLLKNVTKDELVAYFKKHIILNGAARRSLSIHIKGMDNLDEENVKLNANTLNNCNISTKEKITEKKIKIIDLSTFKSSKELYPVARPFLNIKPKGAKCKL